MSLKQPRSLCHYASVRPRYGYDFLRAEVLRFLSPLHTLRIEAASLVRELPGWSLVQRVRARMAESEIDRLYLNLKVAMWNQDIADGLAAQYRKEVRGINEAIRLHNVAIAKARLNVRR